MTTRTRLFALAALGTLALAGCSDSDVGDVSLGVFTLKDIKINHFVDPVVTGVTCHVASIEANLSLSDPSNNSVSCQQTGPITPAMIEAIDKSKSGEVVFHRSKSIFFKNMKIRRIFDQETQTLLYVSYTTKETSGSFHHSLSTVPLWGTQAYKRPLPPLPAPGAAGEKRF
ncbi:MAG: CreA family protein [Burkholderiaceae bacterium]|nr:CreA family protein [Burkholderiaceae bacterium]